MTETTQKAPTREILIGTPTADGILTTGYADSLVAAMRSISASGGLPLYQSVDFHDSSTGRNHIVHTALARPSISHVLFIDNDMKIRREVFDRLIAAAKPVIGGAYAKRQIDLEAYAKARAEGHTPDVAKALASPFVARFGTSTSLAIRQGMSEVIGVGMGCTLIETALLRRMIAAGGLGQQDLLPVSGAEKGGKMWDFFSRMFLGDGQILSDDFAFCERARATEAGTIWCYFGPGIEHQGRMNFGGALVDRLQVLAGGVTPATPTEA